jgi:hypothetical protein
MRYYEAWFLSAAILLASDASKTPAILMTANHDYFEEGTDFALGSQAT